MSHPSPLSHFDNFPSQFNPSVFGTRHVWLGPVTTNPFSADWNDDEREWIGLGLNHCRALGMEIVYEAHEQDSDYQVRRWPDFDTSKRTPGRTSVEKQVTWLDPSFIPGKDAFIHTVGHEFMSSYGCLHIRADSSAAESGPLDSEGNVFSPVEDGQALMNQFLPAEEEITAEPMRSPGVITVPSWRDILEFNRVWALRR